MQLFGMYVPWNVKVKVGELTVECDVTSAAPMGAYPNAFCDSIFFLSFFVVVVGVCSCGLLRTITLDSFNVMS